MARSRENRINRIGRNLVSREKSREKARKLESLSEGGFTLLEALIAMAVLSIGIVGLISVASRTTVSAVKAWDRTQKGFIAQARLEEHKALLYYDYRPEMPLSTYKPVRRSNAVAVTAIDFEGNTINISASDNMLFSCTENNYITQNTGFGISFPPTPGWNATDYYRVADPAVPVTAWVGKAENATQCDHNPRNIRFDVETPPNQAGQLTLWFVDYGAFNRSQQVKIGGVVRAEGIYSPDDIPLSTTPAAPTTFSIPVSRFDTNSGKLGVEIEQIGVPNEWGFILDSGNNETGMTIVCPEMSLIFTPTPTTTYTPECVPGTCCFSVGENHFYRNGFSDGGSYMFPSNTAGYARYEFTINQAGTYRIRGLVRSNTNWGTTNNSIDVSITDTANNYITTNNFGASEARWEMNSNTFVWDFASHRGTGSDFAPQFDPAEWTLSPGTYRIRFERAEANNYLRIDEVCLWFVSAPPTATPTPLPVTPTPTPTIVMCTFPAAPTPVILLTNPNLAPGFTPVPCDNDVLRGLAASGRGGFLERLTWETGDLTDVDGDPGIKMEYPGKILASIHLMAGMSVTQRTDFTVGQPITTGLASVADGWYNLEANVTGVGRRILRLHFDFHGVEPSAVHHLAIDGVRVVYNQVNNPDSVLSGVRFSALDTYVDNVTYAPYIVESRIQAHEGSTGGYQIQVVVRDPNDKNRPLTLTNTISP